MRYRPEKCLHTAVRRETGVCLYCGYDPEDPEALKADQEGPRAGVGPDEAIEEDEDGW